MKCTNCGTQFDEGIFCPECGTKCVMEETVETATVMEAKIEKGKTEKVDVEKTDVVNTEKSKKKDKIPWYLSIPFILVVYMFTFWFLGIPGIILAIIRLIKYKKKVGTVFFIFLMLSPYILVVWLIVDNIKFENEIDSLISTGQYSQARTILDEKIEYGSQYMYFRLYCESYEAEGNYDEAAKIIIEYCNREETPLDITSGACDKLQELKEKVSPDIYNQIIQIEESIVQAEAEKKAEEEKKVEAEKESLPTIVEEDSKQEEKNDLEETTKKGFSCAPGFDEGDLIKSEEIFLLLNESGFENIYLKSHQCKDLDEEEAWGHSQLDKVEVELSHYDENGYVGIEITERLNFMYDGSAWFFKTSVMEDALFDMSGLEGKKIVEEGTVKEALWFFEDLDVEEEYDGTATMTFHDVDRVKTKMDEEAVFGGYFIYSDKPILKVEAEIDGEKYEGDFCLYETTEYYYSDNSWHLDLVFEDENGETIDVPIDLTSSDGIKVIGYSEEVW